jgi:hypothetical protein
MQWNLNQIQELLPAPLYIQSQYLDALVLLTQILSLLLVHFHSRCSLRANLANKEIEALNEAEAQPEKALSSTEEFQSCDAGFTEFDM